MKKIIYALLISMLLSIQFMPAQAAEASAFDKIVAIVNDDVITKSELNHAISLVKIQIAQSNMAAPKRPALEKQVLDQLISKKLQMDMAKQAGVSITDQEVDNAVKKVAEQNHITTSELFHHINKDGMKTADYKQELRNQILMQKVQQQEVVNRIHITTDEVDSFMHSRLFQDNSAKEYHLQNILIPFSDTPKPEEITLAKERAHDILNKIQAGESFDKIAHAKAHDKLSLEGGDLGWRKLPEIPSAFATHVVSMQPKEVAGPIQTPNGIHLIRLVDSRSIGIKQPKPTRKQIENLLFQRKYEEAVQNWVSKLRSQAFIKIML